MIFAVLALLTQQSVTVEQSVAEESYFVGQVIPVSIVVGVDADFADQSLIQLFRRSLDLPLQLELPWLQSQELRVLGGPPNRSTGRTMAVAGEPLRVEVLSLPDGRLQAEMSWQVLAVTPGSLRLAGPQLRYAYATEFERSLLGGRRPKNRLEGSAEDAAVTLEILPLPLSNRPEDFGGAVGHFELEVQANRTQVAVGESVVVELRITGDGDLAGFTAPDYGQLPEFDLLGQLEKDEPEARVLVYEFAPRNASVDEIPPLRFVYFDPENSGRYRVLTTAPLALEVLGDEGEAVASEQTSNLRWPLDAEEGPRWRAAESIGAWMLALLPTAVVLLLLGHRAWRQLQSRPQYRLRRAARRFLARASSSDVVALRRGFEDYLAEVVDHGSPVAVIAAPDLEMRLNEAGMSAPVARSVVVLAGAILATEYGGRSRELADAALRDFAASITEARRG